MGHMFIFIFEGEVAVEWKMEFRDFAEIKWAGNGNYYYLGSSPREIIRLRTNGKVEPKGCLVLI